MLFCIVRRGVVTLENQREIIYFIFGRKIIKYILLSWNVFFSSSILTIQINVTLIVFKCWVHQTIFKKYNANIITEIKIHFHLNALQNDVVYYFDFSRIIQLKRKIYYR